MTRRRAERGIPGSGRWPSRRSCLSLNDWTGGSGGGVTDQPNLPPRHAHVQRTIRRLVRGPSIVRLASAALPHRPAMADTGDVGTREPPQRGRSRGSIRLGGSLGPRRPSGPGRSRHRHSHSHSRAWPEPQARARSVHGHSALSGGDKRSRSGAEDGPVDRFRARFELRLASRGRQQALEEALCSLVVLRAPMHRALGSLTAGAGSGRARRILVIGRPGQRPAARRPTRRHLVGRLAAKLTPVERAATLGHRFGLEQQPGSRGGPLA